MIRHDLVQPFSRIQGVFALPQSRSRGSIICQSRRWPDGREAVLSRPAVTSHGPPV